MSEVNGTSTPPTLYLHPTRPTKGALSLARLLTATGCVGLLVLGLFGLVASPAGAVSSHYLLMTQQLARGVPLGCADVDYAAGQGLIDPVEVRWLSAAGVKCPNEQYEVMLALGTKGQLGCADVEWNAANGLVNYNQAAGLLWRVPGCVLTKYAFLVSLSAQGAVRCVDVDWHQSVGLISPTQAGWLKAALATQGINCAADFGTRQNPAPKGYRMDAGDWWLSATAWEPDVTAQVHSYNQFNDAPPPGYVYARMTVSATYKGTGTGNPLFIRINVTDAALQAFQRATVAGGGPGGDPHELTDQAATFAGGTVSGAIYYLMPAGSAAGPVLGFIPNITYTNVPGGVGFFRVN